MSDTMQPERVFSYDEQTHRLSPYLLWVIWLMWLPFLIQPAVAVAQMQTPFQRVASIIGLILFVAVYLWGSWKGAYRLTRLPVDAPLERGWWIPVAILTLLSIILPFIQGAWGLGGFIYTSASLSSRVTTKQAVFVFGGLMLLVIVIGEITGIPWSTIGLMLFLVPAVGATTAAFGRAILTNRELRLARREIARLAVSEERLRFARDLHDLLGHTLSLITLKSELAGQLIPEDPTQAQREVHDIEAAARTALQEVREAVAGYRQSTLASELLHAQELLAAAGIQCRVEDENVKLPPAQEALLTWVVREGVTNVIRHSRAKHCVIAIASDAGDVRMTLSDDGQGAQSQEHGRPEGNGLRGIAERVAALDGQSSAEPTGARGFQLTVTLPLQAQQQSQQPTASTKEPVKEVHV